MFLKEECVEIYTKMAEGLTLKKYLPKQSEILEIGMGPGKDLDILKIWEYKEDKENDLICVVLRKK